MSLLGLGLLMAACAPRDEAPERSAGFLENARDSRPTFQRLYRPRYPSARTPRLTPLGDFDTPRNYLGQSWRHRGIDIAGESGDPIIAAAPGWACWQRDEINGLSVVQLPGEVGPGGEPRSLVFTTKNRSNDEPDGLRRHPVQIRYAHLRQVAPALRPCGRVELGDVIGAMGDSGIASVPHLHFEIQVLDAARLDGDPSFQGGINPFYLMRREPGEPIGTITCYAPDMDHRPNRGDPPDRLTIIWPVLRC